MTSEAVTSEAAAGQAVKPDGPMIEAEGVGRSFASVDEVIHALSGVGVTVKPGEFLAVRGRSGSGKTTLLNLLGGLDRPSEGRVVVDGREVTGMSERDLVDLRR